MRRLAIIVALGWLVAAVMGAEESKPAVLQVGGYGWRGNRKLRESLGLLQTGTNAPTSYDANFIQDGALIIMSALDQDGYLRSRVEADVTETNGAHQKLEWQVGTAPMELPRTLAAQRVRFTVYKGIQYYYEDVTFTGLQHVTPEDAHNFFHETGTVFHPKGGRVYTPGRAEQAGKSVREVLRRQGYESAEVNVVTLTRDDQSGAVAVRVDVHEGQATQVRSVVVEVYDPDEPLPVETRTVTPNHPYSPFWQQDFIQQLRAEQYKVGRADVAVTMTPECREQVGDHLEVDLASRVERGPEIRIGDVRFEGQKRTRLSVLRRRTKKVKPGGLLNPTEVEEGRLRLSRLGSFDAVGTSYEPPDTPTRDVVYDVHECPPFEVSLLLGYGTYDQVRGGVELEQHNALGLGHDWRLRLVKSMKSTSGDLSYTVPEAFNSKWDAFGRVDALQREELSFTREEFESSVGVQRYLLWLDSRVSARYSLQFLNATDTIITKAEGDENVRVGSFIFDLNQSRLDSMVTPREGRRLYGSLELASNVLGGEVDYQRFLILGSYHHRLLNTLILHLGLSYGVALTLGGDQEALPLNKKFFPGGENSIRGYREGEASPRDKNNDYVGAETYTLGNFQLEQRLTKRLSIVAFVDALGYARDVQDSWVDHGLYSVGGGIGYNTPIGPFRVEYGYNLNSRPRDPMGTLQVSLGFPF